MLILYVIFFLVWFCVNYKRYGMNGSSFLLLLFLVSSISSLALLYYYKTYDSDRISVTAILFHITCYTLFFFPAINFANKNIKSIQLPSERNLNIILYLIIVLSLCTYVSSIPKIAHAFSFSNLSEARKLHNTGELSEDNSGGIIDYLGGIGQGLSFYALFLFFLIFSKKRKLNLILILLFLSSFAIVLSNMTMMGRDGIVRWILFFLFSYFCFKKSLGAKFSQQLVRYSIIPGVILLYIFYLISDSRFGEKDLGVEYSLIDYLGQSNIYFSYGFNQFMDGVAGGAINFSFITGDRVSLNNLNEFVYANYHLNTFSSFVGSFYFDMGLVATFVLAICTYLFLSIYRLIKKNDLTKLVVYLVVFEVYILGVFYYMFYGPTKVNTIALLIILTWVTVFNSKVSLKK